MQSVSDGIAPVELKIAPPRDRTAMLALNTQPSGWGCWRNWRWPRPSTARRSPSTTLPTKVQSVRMGLLRMLRIAPPRLVPAAPKAKFSWKSTFHEGRGHIHAKDAGPPGGARLAGASCVQSKRAADERADCRRPEMRRRRPCPVSAAAYSPRPRMAYWRPAWPPVMVKPSTTRGASAGTGHHHRHGCCRFGSCPGRSRRCSASHGPSAGCRCRPGRR